MKVKHTHIVVWILSSLIAVTISLVFINFLSTAFKQNSSFWVIGLSLILAGVWVFRSGKYWWLFFSAMAFWGGFFRIGFKIFPDEIGITVAVAALAVALFKNYPAIVRERAPVTWAFLLLSIYLAVHMLISLSISRLDWLSGGGSIVRVYASGISHLLFGWMFYKFGASEHIKLAVVITFMVLFIRIIISILYIKIPVQFNISEADLLWLYSMADLRFSALYQVLFGIMLFYLFKARWIKAAIMVFIISMLILVLFGEGRLSVVMAFSTITLWMLLAKRLKLLIYLLPIFIVSILFVYSEAHILSLLPLEVQRAISFIPGLESQLVYNTEASNYWHFDLLRLGFQRWAASFISIIFGNYVDSAGVYHLGQLDYFSRLEIAAGTARYESTLWTILGTLGIVGMALYVWIFTFLFSEIIPIIRREGIISFNHAVYATAIISLLLMVLFGWISGGFPGFELMLGVMAKGLYEDSKRNQLLLREG